MSAKVQRIIAGIQVGRVLGAGASSVVYAGRVLATDQRVAVKIVRPHPSHAAQHVERALQEGRVGWAVRHPNVVRTLEWGTTPDGEVYLVQERLRGRTLGAEVEVGGCLSSGRALAVARQLVAGLSALHARGLLHRDVKPDNVWLCEGPEEQVKLLDMGLVWLDAAHPHRLAHTAAGWSMGTPGYLAPEQVRGEPADVRTDLYGLGATLFCALCGQAPYPTDETYEALEAVAHAEGPPALPISVPQAVGDLLRWLLHPRPEARPASLEVVEAALMDLRPPPPPPSAPAQRPVDFPAARDEGALTADLRARVGAGINAALRAGRAPAHLGRRLERLDALQATRRRTAAAVSADRRRHEALGADLDAQTTRLEIDLTRRIAERQVVRARYAKGTAALIELAEDIRRLDERYLRLAHAPTVPPAATAELSHLNATRDTLERTQREICEALRARHRTTRALQRHAIEARRSLLDVAWERETRLADLEEAVRAGEDQLSTLDRAIEHGFLELDVALRATHVGRPLPRAEDEDATSARVVVLSEGYEAKLRTRSLSAAGGFLYGAEPPPGDDIRVRLRVQAEQVEVPARVLRRLGGVGFRVEFLADAALRRRLDRLLAPAAPLTEP